jgi:hypothetical protein
MKIVDQFHPMHATLQPIAIRCPRCRAEAVLEDAYYILSGEQAKLAAANPSITGVWVGRTLVVIRYPALLPWKELSSVRNRGEMWGICRCGSCGHLGKHRLNWPADAFYAASIRGRTLWAWTRSHVVALRDFVASEHRHVAGLPYGTAQWVKRVPKEILFAKNRAEVVKKLDRLLAHGPERRAAPSRPEPNSRPVIR